jgi:hypothetical protein
LAYSTNSCSVFAGTDTCTISAEIDTAVMTTGTKSLTGSYDGWLMITGLITSSLVVPASSV